MSESAPAEQVAPAHQPLSRAVMIAALAASLMVGGFAISTQSYWIDEATSLIVAMAPSPPGGVWGRRFSPTPANLKTMASG